MMVEYSIVKDLFIYHMTKKKKFYLEVELSVCELTHPN